MYKNRKFSNYNELKILKNPNLKELKELSNLKILNITFENDNIIEKEKEIYLKDIFPNLKKLKI